MPRHENNWFEKARSYDLPLFLEQAYNMDINKSKKCLCPFHDDTKPTLSLKEKGGEWIFKCFSCDATGDITKFVQMKDRLSPLDAVKKVLIHHGEDIDAGEKKPLTEAEQKEIAERAKEAEERKAKKRESEEVLKKDARIQMAKAAEYYAQSLYEAYEQGNDEIIKTVESKFPNIYNNTEVRDLYMGWDHDNESLCLINRNMNGETFNIKAERRLGCFKEWKFGGIFSKFNFPGKWVSWKNATTHAFGFDFMDESDNRVVLCEGEKDTINLLLLGINALTLGGVTNSWDEHKDLLMGKNVFIWFDNDEAGYINAIKRYKEIATIAKSCQVIFFYKLGSFADKYDISDYLVEKQYENKEQVFKAIIFSSFVPTNHVIEELEEHLGKKLDDFKSTSKIKDFKECTEEVLNAVQNVRGEKDAKEKELYRLQKLLEGTNIRKQIEAAVNSLFSETSDAVEEELFVLKDFTKIKSEVTKEYRQTHIYDILNELIRATTSAGYAFATYREILYFWTGSYYHAVEDWEIRRFIFKGFFPAAKIDFKKKHVKMTNEVKDNLYVWGEELEAWADSEKRVVNMENGALIINSNGKTVFRNIHRKQDCAMNILEFKYDTQAKAPKWKAFLARVLPQEEDRETLMEFIGYCLLPSHNYEKFLYLYGASGANGKSVVLSVIRDFFAKENISFLQLHNFEGHELEILRNKIVNIGSEIESGGDMSKQMSVLKNMTSAEDALTINPKNQKQFTVHPEEKPKMIFAANKLVKSGADDGGVLRRMLILNFNQEIKDNEKIRDLPRRLRDEKSGILNMAIEGIKRLIKNNGTFSMSEERKRFMEQYKSDINPVLAYIKECLTEDADYYIAKKFVYAHYQAWCEEKGHKAYASPTFWSKFKEQKGNHEDHRPRKYGHALLASQPRCLPGFKFNTDAISQFEIGNVKLKTEDHNISKITNTPLTVN